MHYIDLQVFHLIKTLYLIKKVHGQCSFNSDLQAFP